MTEKAQEEKPWRVTVNGREIPWWQFATEEQAERQADYHRRANAANPFPNATYDTVRVP